MLTNSVLFGKTFEVEKLTLINNGDATDTTDAQHQAEAAKVLKGLFEDEYLPSEYKETPVLSAEVSSDERSDIAWLKLLASGRRQNFLGEDPDLGNPEFAKLRAFINPQNNKMYVVTGKRATELAKLGHRYAALCLEDAAQFNPFSLPIPHTRFSQEKYQTLNTQLNEQYSQALSTDELSRTGLELSLTTIPFAEREGLSQNIFLTGCTFHCK